MSGWEQYRRRHRLVVAVADDVSRHGVDSLDSWRAAIDVEFGDLGAFLQDVQRHWHTAVDAHLDGLLETAPSSRPVGYGSVAAVLATAARANPQLVAVLDEYVDHPALTGGRQRLRRTLLAATGVDIGASVRDVPAEVG
ncbi:hypothetical protein [Haloechinothrix sp. LS1_15]|uniref:hypothetical protein n=1 Tax=Haloechinothrix sp. LS1_15 TaxID=2652248 RepID=UPI002948AA61|nr:hypothetical protein [Haloechinothrix sp. LS1_15]MDV6011718.1 hypothetical protein [Haloechinothrix sp. LS1_15]